MLFKCFRHFKMPAIKHIFWHLKSIEQKEEYNEKNGILKDWLGLMKYSWKKSSLNTSNFNWLIRQHKNKNKQNTYPSFILWQKAHKLIEQLALKKVHLLPLLYTKNWVRITYLNVRSIQPLQSLKRCRTHIWPNSRKVLLFKKLTFNINYLRDTLIQINELFFQVKFNVTKRNEKYF